MRAGAAIAALLVCCAVAPLGVQAGGVIPPPRSALSLRDWSVGAKPNLVKSPPSAKLVTSFLRSIEEAAGYFSALGEKGGTYVCSFSFADFRHDGFLSLIAGIGVVDRPSCRYVEIIDRTPAGFEEYHSGGAIDAGRNVSADIKDLHHDGKLEFLLASGLGAFPLRCYATWTAIYTWTGANYTNVSDQFKDFYRQRFDEINRIIPALREISGANGYSLREKECLEAEAAAIQRFLGVSSDAGIDQAIRLATSTDSSERQFAAELLGQIGTPRAREYLEKLANGKDPAARYNARSELSRTREGPFVADAFVHK